MARFIKEKRKIFLFSSLCLNIALLCFFGLLYVKGASIQDALNKVKSMFSERSNQFENDWYYLSKESQFSDLTIDENSVVFIGDSLTDMGEWPEMFTSTNVKNRGIERDKVLGVLNRINSVVQGHPKKIFLLIGTNDLTDNKFDNSVIENYRSIIKVIKKASPSTKVYIQSVLPINDTLWIPGGLSEFVGRKQTNEVIIKFNNELEKITEEEGVKYIELFDSFIDGNGKLKESLTYDGLHLNGEGYKIWKEIVGQFVTE